MDTQRDDGKLTVDQAAERLGLNRDQVYRRIVAGQLRADRVREGKHRYLVSAEAIEEYETAGGTAGVNTSAMLRVPEVAQMMGFTVETVRRLLETGKLPYVRGAGRHGHFRIPRTAVVDYLKANGIQTS